MRKFILFLMLPLLMVMSGFAAEYELEGDNDDYYFHVVTDYEKDDISIEVQDLGIDDDGDFIFNLWIVNESKNKLIIDYSESGLVIIDEDAEPIEGTEVLFDEDGLSDIIPAKDEYVIPSELVMFNYDTLSEYGGVATSYLIELEIKGKTYDWILTGIIAD